MVQQRLKRILAILPSAAQTHSHQGHGQGHCPGGRPLTGGPDHSGDSTGAVQARPVTIGFVSPTQNLQIEYLSM